MLRGPMGRAFICFIAMLALIVPPDMTAAGPEPPTESVLDLFQIPWQSLGFDIVFLPPRTGFRAMTFPAKQRIEVYARSQDDVDLLAFDIAHEIGHAIDVTQNTPEKRKEWMRIRGIDAATPWFGCDRCSDYNTPAGDFAETFALLLRGPKHFRGRIAARPTADEMRALSGFFPKDFLPTKF